MFHQRAEFRECMDRLAILYSIVNAWYFQAIVYGITANESRHRRLQRTNIKRTVQKTILQHFNHESRPSTFTFPLNLFIVG